MTTRTPPICADCRWFAERRRHRVARCTHPDQMRFEHIYGRHHVAARDARGAKSECGPDGNLWEAKPQETLHERLRGSGAYVFGAIALFLTIMFWMR